MSIATYMDETVQQSLDFLDDKYVDAMELTKPTKLVYNKAIKMFIMVTKLINKNYPNDNQVELSLSEGGVMVVSWISEDFSKKYVVEVSEEDDGRNRKLKVSVNKNFEF